MWNNFVKIKSFSLGSFIFSALSLASLLFMILSLSGVFITYVKESDVFYEYLLYKDFLIVDKSSGILYTEYFSLISGYILIGIFIIFFIFSLFFKISLYKCLIYLTKNNEIENSKVNFLLIAKFNIVFGIVCGILLLSTLSVLIDEKRKKLNELL